MSNPERTTPRGLIDKLQQCLGIYQYRADLCEKLHGNAELNRRERSELAGEARAYGLVANELSALLDAEAARPSALQELADWKESALASLARWHALGDVLMRRYPVELGRDMPTRLRELIEAEPEFLASIPVPLASIPEFLASIEASLREALINGGPIQICRVVAFECDRLRRYVEAARPTPGASAGDLYLSAADAWVEHGSGCNADPCPTCDLVLNRMRLARKVWQNSAHQAVSRPTPGEGETPNHALLRLTDHVTRVEVITQAGRAYTRCNCSVEPQLQDMGQTLKLFLSQPAALSPSPTGETDKR